MSTFKSGINGNHDAAPHHRQARGITFGPHHPPHIEILAGIEWISAQIAESEDAANERLARVEEKLDTLISALGALTTGRAGVRPELDTH